MNPKDTEFTTCGKDILLSKIKDKRMCCLKNEVFQSGSSIKCAFTNN